MFFVDRVQEMSVLQTAYEKPESSLFVLYGRRRVGKTTLLSEFCKEKPSLYYLATEESIQANRNAFRLMAADFLQNDLLKSATDASWEMIFPFFSLLRKIKNWSLCWMSFSIWARQTKHFLLFFKNLGYYSEKQKCRSDSLRLSGSHDDGADPFLLQPFVWTQNGTDSAEADSIRLLRPILP